jgi:hypothetical protein
MNFTRHMKCDRVCGVVVLWCCVLKYLITMCLDLIFRDYFNLETLLICITKDDLLLSSDGIRG